MLLDICFKVERTLVAVACSITCAHGEPTLQRKHFGQAAIYRPSRNKRLVWKWEVKCNVVYVLILLFLLRSMLLALLYINWVLLPYINTLILWPMTMPVWSEGLIGITWQAPKNRFQQVLKCHCSVIRAWLPPWSPSLRTRSWFQVQCWKWVYS